MEEHTDMYGFSIKNCRDEYLTPERVWSPSINDADITWNHSIGGLLPGEKKVLVYYSKCRIKEEVPYIGDRSDEQ